MSDMPVASANTALTAILTGTMFLRLSTGDPGTTTTPANEVSGGSYTGQSITFAAASAGSKASSNAQAFTSMPSTTVTNLFVDSAASGAGTYLWGGALGSSLTVPAAATVDFAIGAVVGSIS